LLHVTCWRPFPSIEIVEALRHCKAISVIERLDIPMMQSNPLLTEIKAAFADAISGTPGYPEVDRLPRFYGGSAGLGSRDVRAGDFIAIVDNMRSESPRTYFSLGIKHETALPITNDPDVRTPGSFSMRGHSVGGYGSVTTNKVIATIAGEVFGMDVQAYPKYGSEKKGLPTTYYLTIAKDHIRVHSELENVEFIPLNDVNAFNLENPLAGLSQNGMVFVQSPKTDTAEIWAAIPAWARRSLIQKNARLFALDTVKIAKEVSSLADLQQRMQGIVLLGVFLRVTPFTAESGISEEALFTGVEKALRKYFGKRGERVVQDNLKAVSRGYRELMEVPRDVMLANPGKGQVAAV
jgi:pyruvate-ferredoxin/flavodoxin oxidoreductase